MPPLKRVLLSWSSGKDSAWALYQLQQQVDVELVGLVTTVNEVHQRVAMHAVRRSLLKKQAEAAQLPLYIINIPSPCSNTLYSQAMSNFFETIGELGATHMAFGDLYLEEIRDYRINQLKQTALEPLFPLWQIPTASLARKMLINGLKAKLTCIDPKKLTSSFAGREYNLSFLADLPETVDPCGENGEFHTFAYDGPMFSQPVKLVLGEVIERDGFIFADLLEDIQ